MSNRIRLNGVYNDDLYWQRVNRSLCWLAEGDAAQRVAQLKLSNAIVGVAGCGGIGGALAMRLARHFAFKFNQSHDPTDLDHFPGFRSRTPSPHWPSGRKSTPAFVRVL